MAYPLQPTRYAQKIMVSIVHDRAHPVTRRPLMLYMCLTTAVICVSQGGPLLGLQQPMLFVKGEADEQCPTGLLAQLLLSDQMACRDARLLVVPVSGRPSRTIIEVTLRCTVQRHAQQAIQPSHLAQWPQFDSFFCAACGPAVCGRRRPRHAAAGAAAGHSRHRAVRRGCHVWQSESLPAAAPVTAAGC
jgi:hypothetical protein